MIRPWFGPTWLELISGLHGSTGLGLTQLDIGLGQLSSTWTWADSDPLRPGLTELDLRPSLCDSTLARAYVARVGPRPTWLELGPN